MLIAEVEAATDTFSSWVSAGNIHWIAKPYGHQRGRESEELSWRISFRARARIILPLNTAASRYVACRIPCRPFGRLVFSVQPLIVRSCRTRPRSIACSPVFASTLLSLSLTPCFSLSLPISFLSISRCAFHRSSLHTSEYKLPGSTSRYRWVKWITGNGN